MIDTQKKYLDMCLATNFHLKLNLVKKQFILVTLHRPSNVDNLERLKKIMLDIIKLSERYTIVYPIHPRTLKNLEKINILNKKTNLIFTEPLGYLHFTCLIANSLFVITDSGGIQEETTSLKIPCFTLRRNTERPITLRINSGTNKLINCINEIDHDEIDHNEIDHDENSEIALWDGNSAWRFLEIFKSIIN